MGTYTRGEVIWLLSMNREQAIACDADQRDSCAGLSDDHDSGGASAEPDALPVIARWIDVKRARMGVIREKEETAIRQQTEALAILQLRTGGFSEREIARISHRERLAVRRRWHASVDEILARLGGAADPNSSTSRVAFCLRCAQAPRVRLSAVRRRVKGGFRVIEPEKQASVCAACLSPELAPRIMGEVAAAA